MSQEPTTTAATVNLDLTPVMVLIESVRQDIKEVRKDVSEISVDHAQRITRNEDGLETIRDRVSSVEARQNAIEQIMAAWKLGEAKDGAIQKMRVRRIADWRWRVGTLTGLVAAVSGWAVFVYYLAK